MSAEIRTTLGGLVQAEGALQRLTALRLPVKAAYHLSKLFGLVRAELKTFHEQRLVIVKELGTQTRDTVGDEQWQVSPEHMPAFTTRVGELVAIEVTLPWGPLDLTPLTTIEISADDLWALGPLVTLTTAAETQA